MWSTAVVLDEPLAVTRRILWIRVCLSILPSFPPFVFSSFHLSIFPSFRPSVWKFSWDWLISFFLKLSMVLEAYVLCMTEADFFKKICCPKNGENRPKIGLKIGFFGFIGKFSHQFFLNLVYKESSYYLLYSCTNPILGKNLILEIWAKMLLANQIAGFLNWVYLENTKMKKPDFLHVDTD